MAPERRRKACKECRQQKIRCDAEPPATCSRCRRLSLGCVLAPNPHARQTKAQLQRELESLINGTAPTAHIARAPDSVTLPPTPGPIQELGSSSSLDGTGGYASAPSDTETSLSRLHPAASMPFSSVATSSAGAHDWPTPASDIERCASRSLDGLEIDARKIRDCFTLFFRHYAPLLPIIDPLPTPNEFYSLSPFLFWSIVFIGSRRYTRDPTILGTLAPRINLLALQSLESRATPIQTIQGLLILCLWPVPMNTMHKDISHVLSGAAVHLAMQIGLHVVGSGQDFARTRLEYGPSQTIFRAQLWIHCLLVGHSTSLREGLPPLLAANSTTLGPDDDGILSEFPEELRIRRKIHNVAVSFTTVMAKSMQDPSFSSSSNSLSPFISLFDAQFVDILGQCHSPIASLYALSCRLHLLVYYFFESPNNPNQAGMMRLYSVACSLLDSIWAEDQRVGFVEVCPAFIERCVLLAAVTILKISRSFLAQHVDLEAGERAYFNAILFNRRSSLQNDDLSARAVNILSQLWTSKHIFKQPNGQTQSLVTQIRSRLAMSIVFDSFWWWREEFAGQPSPYRDETATAARGSEEAPPIEMVGPESAYVRNDANQAETEAMQFAGSAVDTLQFPGDPFPDFDWAANFDFDSLN